jgi:hypothetical protein
MPARWNRADAGSLWSSEPMSKTASGTESSIERTEQRARWEAFAFTVPAANVVKVENESYGDESDEHQYLVNVANGETTGCSCPSDEHRPGKCKHRVAVEAHPAVMLAAAATGDELDAAREAR